MQGYLPDLYKNDGTGFAVSLWTDLDLPGARQMQYVKEVITDRSTFFDRIPDQSIIINNTHAGENYITATRDHKGSFIMVYTPAGKSFVIETANLNSKDVKASWYDPTTGSYEEFHYSSVGSSQRMFTPPKSTSHSDWILVLETRP
jgi:site-specific recombinase